MPPANRDLMTGSGREKLCGKIRFILPPIVHNARMRSGEVTESEGVINPVGSALVAGSEKEFVSSPISEMLHLASHYRLTDSLASLGLDGVDVSENADAIRLDRHNVPDDLTVQYADMEPGFQTVTGVRKRPFQMRSIMRRFMSQEGEYLPFPFGIRGKDALDPHPFARL